jgi:O-acetyl-ADP-ribose deacetylase (regulator of RNase III)
MTELVGKVGNCKIYLQQGDIILQATDAIVNAANSGLAGGGGVDGAIHRAGGPSIMDECRVIRQEKGKCPAGSAVITGGGNLKAKHVIHAVGPIWNSGRDEEAATLASAYQASLQLAAQAKARTVSFPSISTGAYGYPVKLAAHVALKEIKNSAGKLENEFDEIYFVLFDATTFTAYKKAAEEVFSLTKGQ